jgi:cobalt/nickel transport system permease protein
VTVAFDLEYFNIGQLDMLSYRDSVIHRLDARGKVIGTAFFLLAVISYSPYEVLPLIPFFSYPMLLLSLSGTPFSVIAKRVALVSPFAILIGIFNPLFDRQMMMVADGVFVSAGWISFLAIMLKFVLTVSAALLLIATTSFPSICHALQRMGMPSLFAAQLMFLYRYIFVLMEEAMRLIRARDMRSQKRHGKDIRTFARIIGVLFSRSVLRAERVYGAMLSRGFAGEIPTIKADGFRLADTVFLSVTLAAIAVLRMFDLTAIVGRYARTIAP